MTAPRLSVIMAAYEAERYIRQAIDSVLSQTLRDFELIVIDDGSTDQTGPILKEYERVDPRVRVVSRPNTGLTLALNEGIELARSELIGRMDADDICLPDRFEMQIEFLNANPRCVMVGGQAVKIDPDGIVMYKPSVPLDHESIERALLRGGHAIWHPSTIIRRSALRQVGGYEVSLAAAQDTDLWLRLAEVGRLANLPDVILQYRVHLDNVTHARRAVQLECKCRAIQRACERRGLPVPSMALPPTEPRRSNTPAWWAIQTLMYGRGRDARRLARKAIRRSPASPKSWIAFVLTHAMGVGRAIARRLMMRPSEGRQT